MRGAEKFSTYFGAYLADKYDFTDNCGNTDYASWDDAFKAWSEQAIIAHENIAVNAERLKNINR